MSAVCILLFVDIAKDWDNTLGHKVNQIGSSGGAYAGIRVVEERLQRRAA